MAEQIPYSAVASLINMLASSAFLEFGRINGVMDELQSLKNSIESIKAVLLDAEEKQDEDYAVKDWIRSLKEALHAANDLFDDLAVEDLLHKGDGRKKILRQVCHFFSPSNPIVFRLQLSHKMEKIRQKLEYLVVDMSNLKLRPRRFVEKQIERSAWWETSYSLAESNIIGRKKSKKEIINLLRQPHGNQHFSLVAIVGIGGLGKTAIAQVVYNDVEVQRFFEKRMWVCVSDNFDVKTIMKKILESLIGGQSNDQKLDQLLLDKLPIENLQNMLCKNLCGKRYLLVLDDIRNEGGEKWSQLRTCLMTCGAQNSKVLVTTRNEFVARTMGVSSQYVLKGLTTKESWDLLESSAFGQRADGMNRTLQSIGKKIAEKCSGVPLTIRIVGGILQSKDKESEWINVLEGDFWKLREDEGRIMPVLKLSYQELSPQLKQCFAYCSLYPKDSEIKKDELIQLWMAQGFLECSSKKEEMEDDSNELVKIFLRKSFFQDPKKSPFGDIYCFKMPALMHDLATMVDGDDCYVHGAGKRLVGRPMHVSLESDAISLLDSLDATRLQTLLVRSNNGETSVQPRRRLSVISSFKCLRVLKMSSSSLNKLPFPIGKLKHLRYLDLSDCRELASLPDSVSALVHLQTLKLNRCYKLEFSTKVVTNLINLRHLDISDCKAFEDMMPAGLRRLSSLQYLSTFVVGDSRESETAKLNELKELNNLRGQLVIKKLSLVRDVGSESGAVNMRDKKLLRCLELHWTDSRHRISRDSNNDSLQLLQNLCPHWNLKRLTVSGYPGVRFSNWLASLTNLSHISLSWCSNCQFLPSLAHLSYLESLDISFMPALEYIRFEGSFSTTSKFFPSLQRLEFKYCDNLTGWQRKDVNSHNLSLPPFPSLSELTVTACPKLACMPPFLHLVKGLELRYSSVKPLAETLNVAAPSFSSSSSLAPLCKLKSLKIVGELVDIKALPNRWMGNLTSLEHLKIEQSQSLSLEEFEIWFMDNLDCLPSLQKISIKYCETLKALPDWMCNLPSLQHMKIRDCPDLESLPEGMPRLTDLQMVEIIECPLLLDRCERQIGADWSKIAHIPYIVLG